MLHRVVNPCISSCNQACHVDDNRKLAYENSNSLAVVMAREVNADATHLFALGQRVVPAVVDAARIAKHHILGQRPAPLRAL